MNFDNYFMVLAFSAALWLIVIPVIHAIICLLLSNLFKSIPPEHHKMDPGLVWLLVIPCFPFIANFFVYPKLSQSFCSYFKSIGDDSVGNCFEDVAWAFAVCTLAYFFASQAGRSPVIGLLFGILVLFALVFQIVFFVKMFGLKRKMLASLQQNPGQ